MIGLGSANEYEMKIIPACDVCSLLSLFFLSLYLLWEGGEIITVEKIELFPNRIHILLLAPICGLP